MAVKYLAIVLILFCLDDCCSTVHNNRRFGISDPNLLWPNGSVPYALHNNLTDTERNAVRKAMNFIEAMSCVKFEPLKHMPSRIETFLGINNEKTNSCDSEIGMRPGKNVMNLGADICFGHATIEHELFHVLGFYHEQNRPDRDKYIKIVKENLGDVLEKNFEKIKDPNTSTFGLPYDINSIMHYKGKWFSKNGKLTILSKDMYKSLVGQLDEATDLDFQKLRAMYKCNGKQSELHPNGHPYFRK